VDRRQDLSRVCITINNTPHTLGTVLTG